MVKKVLVYLVLATPLVSAAQTPTNDASSTNITAAGSTTARTLGDRAASVVNVLDFGARGDWKQASASANDAAFAAAINRAAASGHGRVYVPGGGYVISTQISVPLNVNAIEGEGRNATVIMWKTGAPGRGLAIFRVAQKAFRLAHMRVLGDDSVTPSGAPDYGVWGYPSAEGMSQNVVLEDVSLGEKVNVGIYVSKPPGGAQQELWEIRDSRIDGYAAGIRLDQNHVDLWSVERSYVNHRMPGGACVDFTSKANAIGFKLDHTWLTGGSGVDSTGVRLDGSTVDLELIDSGTEGPAWGIDLTHGARINVYATGKGAGPNALRLREKSGGYLTTQGTDVVGGTQAAPGSVPFIDAGDGTSLTWKSKGDTFFRANSGGAVEADPRAWLAYATALSGTGRVLFDYDHVYSHGFAGPTTIGGKDTGGSSLAWFNGGIPLTVKAIQNTGDLVRFYDGATTPNMVLSLGQGGQLQFGGAALVIQPAATNGNGTLNIHPTGTASRSALTLFSSPTGQSPYLQLSVDGSEARITSDGNGAGEKRDVVFYTNGTEHFRVSGSGITVGGGTPISKSVRATATLAPAILGASSCAADQTVTTRGAATGAECVVGAPATIEEGLVLACFVSAEDTVNLRVCNPTGSPVKRTRPQIVSVRVFNP